MSAVDDVGAVGEPRGDGLIDIDHCCLVNIKGICVGPEDNELLLMALKLWKRMDYEIEERAAERVH